MRKKLSGHRIEFPEPDDKEVDQEWTKKCGNEMGNRLEFDILKVFKEFSAQDIRCR